MRISREFFHIGMALSALLLGARRHLLTFVITVTFRTPNVAERDALRPGEFFGGYMLLDAFMASHALLIARMFEWNLVASEAIGSNGLMALRQRARIPGLGEFRTNRLRHLAD